MFIRNIDFQSAASEFLALAVLDVFPKTKILETYPTDLGFGLDFITDQPIDDRAFDLINERLRILLKRDLSIETIDMMRENAAELFRHHDQNLLAESVLNDSNNIVSLTRVGEHYGYNSITEGLNSKSIGEGRLINYSLKDEKVAIYGDCTVVCLEGVLCKDSKSLRKFIKKYESAKKNDHQNLGRELELFFRPDNAIPGCWTWLPKGETVKEILISYWKNFHQEEEVSFVSTSKWFKIGQTKGKNEQSNPNFVRNKEKIEYLSDPIDVICKIYQLKRRNAGELPLRLAEISEGFSPQMQRENLGLLRADVFTKDTAYNFCTEDQAVEELISSLQFLAKSIKMFAIDYQWYLVSNNPKSTDDQGSWDHGVDMLVEALQKSGFDYVEDSMKTPNRGPRIEARLIDSLGREWEGPSVEISLHNKQRGLHYRGSDNKEHRPILITRSLFGSLERFVAILVEQHVGFLPLWLAPEQVRVIPVKEKHLKYAREVYKLLLQKGIRVAQDRTNETLAAKVFAVKTAKIPYAIVVGDNEQRNGTIAVCPCEDKGKGQQENLSAFIERLLNEIQAKGPSN